jgi:hypothetical protein
MISKKAIGLFMVEDPSLKEESQITLGEIQYEKMEHFNFTTGI